MNGFILAQILGAFAAVIFISSVQFKDKRHIIYFFIAQTIINIAALALLGAWSGLIVNVLTLLPTLYIYHLDRHKLRPKPVTMAVFLVILFIGWAATCSGVADILALIGSSVYTVSLFQRHENNIRGLLIVNQIAWTSYNLIFGLYTGAFFGICFIISDLIAIMRFKKHKKMHRAVHHWWK